MNTFTAQDMHDYGDYVANLNSAMLSPNFEKWCKERFEPAKKVIDLSALIDSQIDCQFSDSEADKEVYIGKLVNIFNSREPYRSDNGYGDIGIYKQCQPRMNHKHAWDGDECPLPEGFMVKVWYRDAGKTEIFKESTKADWLHKDFPNLAVNYNIIYFEVLRVADGYVMPYDKESE
jgi:hypothetical protein